MRMVEMLYRMIGIQAKKKALDDDDDDDDDVLSNLDIEKLCPQR